MSDEVEDGEDDQSLCDSDHENDDDCDAHSESDGDDIEENEHTQQSGRQATNPKGETIRYITTNLHTHIHTHYCDTPET